MLNIYREQNRDEAEIPPQSGSLNEVSPKKKISAKGGPASGWKPTSELKYGLWYVTHRLFLYRLSMGIMVTVCGGLALYSLVLWVIFLAGIPASTNVQKQLSIANNYTVFHAHFNAKALSVDKTLLLQSGSSAYDAVAEIINPNPHFIAQFDYIFVTQTSSTPPMRGFLLPGEDNIFKSGSLTANAGNPTLLLRNVTWLRLNQHTYPDPGAFQSNRLRFTVSDFTFLPSTASVDGLGSSAITFKIKNESAFGYAPARFLIGLYNSDVLVGVLPWQTDSFASLAEKNVDLRSFVPGLSVTNIKLFPSINVYDASVYLAPGV